MSRNSSTSAIKGELTNTELTADVLILGGGPAGTWAAISAARSGARVVLADKGFVGTSGAAAAGGNNLWYVPAGGDGREQSIRRREVEGGHLSDRDWMRRTLDATWAGVDQLARWGYPYPTDDTGTVRRSSLQGPEYMRLMRRQVRRAGVTILDQSPALELLVDRDGVVSGARGVHRQRLNTPWEVSAGAVVLATGGCAFLSGALGCNPDTGDGHLMAAELGAELSGMEFSSNYGMAPAFGAQTKGRMYQFARYYNADGSLLDVPPGFAGRQAVPRATVTQAVYARLDLAPESMHHHMRWAQPNFFLPFDKAGVDPFNDLFQIRFVLEGTVRGTGGLAIADEGCQTTVPGLFAAGDAATRELITGGRSGGGSHNGAWAISSGTWAGQSAAVFARRPRAATAELQRAGQHGLNTEASAVEDTAARAKAAQRAAEEAAEEVVRRVQSEVIPIEKNMFRTEAGLLDSLQALDGLWREEVPTLGGGSRPQRAREAVAMVAHARWMYRAALARKESRAMHHRDDAPETDPNQARRIRVGGLDTVWVAAETDRAEALPTAVELAS
ncbi:FAD-binding protein [Jatrophihabitans sp. DSM 45814]